MDDLARSNALTGAQDAWLGQGSLGEVSLGSLADMDGSGPGYIGSQVAALVIQRVSGDVHVHLMHTALGPVDCLCAGGLVE